MQSGTQIRAVKAEDTEVVAGIIIEMLEDSPTAFGESMTEAQARTGPEWLALVEQMIKPGVATAFLAHDERGPCGFLSADSAFPEAPPNTVLISRVWVAPRQRGTGLGRKLMEAGTQWAERLRAVTVALGVTEMNVRALEFYRHLGYRDIGIRIPWPPDPTRQVIILGRTLET